MNQRSHHPKEHAFKVFTLILLGFIVIAGFDNSSIRLGIDEGTESINATYRQSDWWGLRTNDFHDLRPDHWGQRIEFRDGEKWRDLPAGHRRE